MKNLKQHAKDIIKILQKIYPKPKCALNYKNAFQLLTAVILSAQCTDKRVNMVTPSLFEKYPDAKSFANADITELEQKIYSTGFFRNKAKNIKACAAALLKDYNGVVPKTLSELTKLPGVGRKTGSVIQNVIYGTAEGIVVDTHVARLSQRLGLSKSTTADKIEKDLMKIIEQKYWIDFSLQLILHGRNRCYARKPGCELCELKGICPSR